ncbi:MAG: hypothetical protein HY534_03590 [Chloroflexi bacterium]|nr:hypothetical protein [Chloroflexota bacterium]
MPKINTRYVSGPLDQKIYRAADAAEMPELVVSSFNGGALEWRWQVSTSESNELQEVILQLTAPQGSRALAAVYFVAASPGSRKPAAWHCVGTTAAQTAAEIDEGWLESTLREASLRGSP